MQLIWFRQDLRIHDHSALWHATQAGPCVALLLLTPQQWALHHDAPNKINFNLRRMQVLERELKQLNIPLHIIECPLWRDAPTAIAKLVSQLNITALHANIETGANERQRDHAVIDHLKALNIAVHYYQDRSLFPLGSIRNQSQKPYQVFGAFKKACYAQLSISIPPCYALPEPQLAVPIQASSNDNSRLMQDYISKYAPADLDQSQYLSALWPVESADAWSRLDQFIQDDLYDYQLARDIPHQSATSQLSPYLNSGIISIRQCIKALFTESDGNFHISHSGQQTWLDELLWREFYLHLMHDFPELSQHQPFKKTTQQLKWRDAPEDLKAWQYGQTGIPIVDAGMRQMLHSGWMHNRVRMICAMFLSKNLLIDWRLGEQWFMQHLIDGDLAANNGGWQWCASTGVDAVPYFRIFNPVTQSQRFDAQGDYIRQWLPELAHLDSKQIHAPYARDPEFDLNYPKAIVDLKMSRQRAIEAFRSLS